MDGKRKCAVRPPGARTQLSTRAAQSTLAAMNWRRGILLAGINVAVALPMILILAARDAEWRRDLKQRSTSNETSEIARLPEFEAASDDSRNQEEQTVSFGPCDFRGRVPVQALVVQAGNLPVQIITAWHVTCPSKWSIASKLGIADVALASEANVKPRRLVDLAFCLLIAGQWFLIGGFPLIEARRRWSEPGAFITFCTAIGSGVALIPVIEGLGRLPAVIGFFAWLWYFALLLWKPVHLAWQSTLHSLPRLRN